MLLAIAAAALRPGESLVVADSRLIVSEYTRLFLVLGSVVGLGLGVSGLVVGSSRDAPAATLAILGACALTLGLTDARAAVLAGTLTGLFGVVVTLTPAGGRPGSIVGIREVRAVVVAGTMAIAATAWFGRDLSQLAAQPVVFGLAYLAFAVAVAIRFGRSPSTCGPPVLPTPFPTPRCPSSPHSRRPPLLSSHLPGSTARSRHCWSISTSSATSSS